jgi:hypothetical protein
LTGTSFVPSRHPVPSACIFFFILLAEQCYRSYFAGRPLPKRMLIRVSQEKAPVKNLYSPPDLPRLVPRLPFVSFWMSCPTAGGRQVRVCAELNRSKAIQKRCASCGSKGTFDFRLSFFPGKFLKRILRRTPPPGRQGGQSSSLRRLCFAALPLTSAQATPNTWSPSCADGLRRLLASCCSLIPYAQPLRPPSA